MQPLQFSTLTVRPVLPDLELDLDNAEGSDAIISLSKSGHFGVTESIITRNQDNLTEITRPTEATAVGEDDCGVDGALFPVCGPLHSQGNQHLDNLLFSAEVCNGKETLVYGACVNAGPTNNNVVDAAPGFASKTSHHDPLAVKLNQSIGPGRYGHKPKKCSESGLSAAAVDNLMPVEHLCATEDGSPPTRAQWKASLPPCVCNTARQTQVHELDNAIHRLMPPNRIICFGVDEDSFRYGRVPNDVTKRIISAAVRIEQVIKSQNLGINFQYSPDSASNVFNIRYDSSLGPSTLAQAFFPSDSRETWQLCISRALAFFKSGKNGLLDYIPNILAHEFMHILGLRHWNAGFDPGELREPSVLWPNTIARSRISVMNTGMHPNNVRLSEEDFRVIGEIYSFADGDFYAGRKIVDVNPYAGSYKL